MALKKFNPTSAGRRFMTVLTFDEITKTVYAGALDPERVDELMATLDRLAGLGVDVTIGAIPGVHDPKRIEAFGTDVIPAAARM